MFPLLLFTIGMLARLVIHIPNFTPVSSMSLFSGTYLNKKYSVILPVLFMVLTDSIIGFHETILFTWGSVALTALLGQWLNNHKSTMNIFLCTVASAVIFFVLTNFGTWLMTDLYPRTWQGLVECFILAVPFFRATLLSTLIYSAVFFGAYELVAKNLKATKFANVL